jgi:hypothetical protein
MFDFSQVSKAGARDVGAAESRTAPGGMGADVGNALAGVLKQG